MGDVVEFNSIEALTKSLGGKCIRHPMIELFDLSESEIAESNVNKRVVSSLYSITIKTKTSVPFRYGRKICDFSTGTVFGFAPEQAVSIEYGHKKGDVEGFALYFHPDFLLGTNLYNSIKNYGFFSYDINEALHLSKAEQDSLKEILDKIDQELNQNIDDFSKDILVANIGLLLSYINRYFNRQFITRKHENQAIVDRVKQAIDDYLIKQLQTDNGLPAVEYLARELFLSPGYLSDLLKKEVGKTAQEFIHISLLDKAKQALLASDKSVAEIAFSLGFDYPQYFSRLFKQKVGLSPVAYRKNYN